MKQKNFPIVIGNKSRNIRFGFLILLIGSMLFSLIISSLLYTVLSFNFGTVLFYGILLFLISMLLWTCFLSVSVRYLEIDEDCIRIVDSSSVKQELQRLSNIVIHTRFDVVNVLIHFADIEEIVMYAVENQRIGKLFGEAGYSLRLRIVIRDGSSLVLQDWFDYHDASFIEGLDYLKQKGVVITDPMRLMEIIRQKGSITEYVNRRSAK